MIKLPLSPYWGVEELSGWVVPVELPLELLPLEPFGLLLLEPEPLGLVLEPDPLGLVVELFGLVLEPDPLGLVLLPLGLLEVPG